MKIMSYTYSFKINFANKEENMKDILLSTGKARIIEKDYGDHAPYISINFRELCPEAFNQYFVNTEKGQPNLERDEIGINFTQDGGLQYFSKWKPDERIANCLSKYFKDDVLSVDVDAETSRGDYFYYCKDAKGVLKDGTPLITNLVLKNTMVKPSKNNNVKITLPIGDENDRWAHIILPKNQVYTIERTYTDSNGDPVTCETNSNIYFIQDKVNVYFESKETVEMSTHEVCSRYKDSVNRYINYLNSPVTLYDLPIDNISYRKGQFGDYYIVKVPVPTEVSSDGFMSITRMESQIDFNEQFCNVNLGRRREYVHGITTNSIQTEMKTTELLEKYESVIGHQENRITPEKFNERDEIPF